MVIKVLPKSESLGNRSKHYRTSIARARRSSNPRALTSHSQTYDDIPSLPLKFSAYSSVSLHVLIELILPETKSTLRCICLSAARMSMPETPVHEDNGFVSGEDECQDFPGRSFLCRRKRYPMRCRADRTSSSGVVSFPRIRDMFQLRWLRVRLVHVSVYSLDSNFQVISAICRARSGGTALPTWVY